MRRVVAEMKSAAVFSLREARDVREVFITLRCCYTFIRVAKNGVSKRKKNHLTYKKPFAFSFLEEIKYVLPRKTPSQDFRAGQTKKSRADRQRGEED